MELTADEWADWVVVAVSCNAHRPPDEPAVGRKGQASGPPSADAPGTDFNLRGSWEETGLFEAGWRWERKASEASGLLRRPGKERGVSASVGMVSSQKNGWPLFFNWSTSVPEFKADVPYSRFAVFAVLNHAGDFAAAARDLASRGYGARQSRPIMGEVATDTAADEPDGPRPDRIFLWMSELRQQVENEKWLWKGYISRGGVTLLSALWKIGKSTLLSHLVRAFDGRETAFLGQGVVPSRVLYVTEEHEERWAERRDDLGIGDHVGMICRPFRARATGAQWVEFIGKVARTVAEHQFDLVIFDTLSKMWPVRDENDAGQVEEALMPVWAITDTGAGLLLVHHTRKSGGAEFTGARGSGGLPAFCDTLMEFNRNSESTKDSKRLLGGKGRYKETPDKLLIELLPTGYVSHGDADDADAQAVFGKDQWREAVMGFIPDSAPGVTKEELLHRMGDTSVRRQDLVAWLNARHDDGELERDGKGVRGDPFRFRKLPFHT